MKEVHVEVYGTRVRVLEAGSGPPVVYLHGVDGPRDNPLLTELTKSHRVIAPEIPGFGLSRLPDWMMGIGDAALFGLDLLSALRLEKIHLAGHSIGGWMAAEMAIRSTARLLSLTLISPAGIVPREAPGEDIFAHGPERVMRALYHDQAMAEVELAARANEDIDILLQNRTGLARLGWSPRLASVQLPYWLHRIDVPTLLVWGEADRITPFSCHEVFAREIAGATFVPHADCGHAAPNERGVDIARRMSSHFAGAGR